MPTSAERVLADDRGVVLSSLGWAVDGREDVKKEIKKENRVRKRSCSGKGSGSFIADYSGYTKVRIIGFSRQRTRVSSGTFDCSCGGWVCKCCVNSSAGRQGSGGGNNSTAGAEQPGQARLAHGTESTQLYSGQVSWLLTTAREAVEIQCYKENKYRCVTDMRNLNRTAFILEVFFSYSDCYPYIVYCLNVHRNVSLSTRIYIGLILLFVGVEEQRHV
jgi:hypothetical protein